MKKELKNLSGLKKIFILSLMCLTISLCFAQKPCKIVGNEIVVENTVQSKADKDTGLTYKGYKVYKSERGSYYIIRVSKKTGKEYKQYLPKEIQEELRKSGK